jgi:hypothetical protein
MIVTSYPENKVSKKGNKKLSPYLTGKIWDKNKSIST